MVQHNINFAIFFNIIRNNVLEQSKESEYLKIKYPEYFKDKE
jgi:hypothetical protein